MDLCQPSTVRRAFGGLSAVHCADLPGTMGSWLEGILDCEYILLKPHKKRLCGGDEQNLECMELFLVS